MLKYKASSEGSWQLRVLIFTHLCFLGCLMVFLDMKWFTVELLVDSFGVGTSSRGVILSFVKEPLCFYIFCFFMLLRCLEMLMVQFKGLEAEIWG
mgnify:CR=1 FL=1